MTFSKKSIVLILGVTLASGVFMGEALIKLRTTVDREGLTAC